MSLTIVKYPTPQLRTFIDQRQINQPIFAFHVDYTQYYCGEIREIISCKVKLIQRNYLKIVSAYLAIPVAGYLQSRIDYQLAVWIDCQCGSGSACYHSLHTFSLDLNTSIRELIRTIQVRDFFFCASIRSSIFITDYKKRHCFTETFPHAYID